jgi:hypothetical protein
MQPILRVDAPAAPVIEQQDPLALDPKLAVTNHAVTRYVQRILGKVIDQDIPNKRDEARAHCALVGLSISEVRERIWTPGVAMAVKMGLPVVDNGKFSARINPVKRTVVTILPPRNKHHGRLRLLSERELQQRGQRIRRKEKHRPKAAMPKALIHEEGTEDA